MTIKNYDPIIALLRGVFLANSDIYSIVGDEIYPDYINAIDNPKHPALTIHLDMSQSLKSKIPSEETYYYVHGWTKRGPDEASYLYNLVIDAIDLKPPTGITSCRKTQGSCPLYDNETRTHYFMAKFLIYAPKSLMYT